MSCYAGGCHCGNVRYQYETAVLPEQWSVRRCTCTFCLRLAARYTSAADAQLALTVLYASMVQRYEFGTKTAEFLRCARCGVMIAALSGNDSARIAVLNVNTLDDIESLALQTAPANFDGEVLDDRLARRQANWIQGVTIDYVNA